MDFFFELLKNRCGFSRIGRINLLGSQKPIKTPNLIIPLNQCLMKNLDFIESFGDHKLFLISNEEYIEEQFLNGMFKDSGFLYTHYGTLEKFIEIFNQKKEIFLKYNLSPIIPFNVPTTTINLEFMEQEIKHYLAIIENFLNNNPKTNFGLSIKLFEYYNLIDYYIPLIKKHNNLKILNFLDIFNNLSYFRNILETTSKIKTELDNNLVLMASGSLISKYFPMLVYLGFDVINSTYLTYLSTENYYDTIELLIPSYKMKFLPCDCLACKGKLKDLLEVKYSEEKISLLCYHNLITSKNYMNKIIQYLHTEDFRSFIEKSSLNDLNFISMLRILDRDYFELIKKYTLLTQKNKIVNSLGPSSYHRPDFKYFRKQTIKTFRPESWTNLILLLPCSAKKPYSRSRSHQYFYKAIRKFPEFPNFQEIILTSPLGAIPRQLENIYPVNSYDISVTGDWNSEELEISSKILIELLSKYDKNIPIVCHLEGGYREIAKKAEKDLAHKFYYSKEQEGLTSKSSLKSLQILIEEHKDDFTSEKILQASSIFTKSWPRKFSKIIDYQFGNNFGRKIFSEGIFYKPNRTNTKIQIFHEQMNNKLATFKFSTGKIKLTIDGAKKIAYDPHFSKFLVFDGNKIRGTTLFRPGIKHFPANLLPTDNICIFDQDKADIIAMGNMIVSSNFIKNSNSGRIVKLYETK
jgi:archaeosine synthase